MDKCSYTNSRIRFSKNLICFFLSFLTIPAPSHVDMNEEVCCSLPQTIGSSVGTFAFGFVVAVVAMVTVVKLRQKHSGTFYKRYIK